MKGIRTFAVLCALLACAAGPAAAWSYLDEVTVIDPMLSVSMAFEMPAAKTYCEASPESLDRIGCTISQVENFWFGTDAAGNRYGSVVTVDPNGEYFTIMRRPPGTQISQPVLRITKRIEPVFGEVTKLQVSGTWTVDPSNGEMTITFRGQCLSAACVAAIDTQEHYGTIRVMGLPDLFTISSSYLPPGTLSFRLPAVPFGLPTGSRVDVYTGALGTLPDLALAEVFECDVADGHTPGDRITVNDPLPDPAPGAGRYYLTTVTYGTETRAGVRTIEPGVPVGRDPTGLPSCS